MESPRPRTPASQSQEKDQAARRAEIQRRVEAKEKLNKLADAATGESTYKSTAIFIIGAVILAIIVAVLYATLM